MYDLVRNFLAFSALALAIYQNKERCKNNQPHQEKHHRINHRTE